MEELRPVADDPSKMRVGIALMDRSWALASGEYSAFAAEAWSADGSSHREDQLVLTDDETTPLPGIVFALPGNLGVEGLG